MSAVLLSACGGSGGGGGGTGNSAPIANAGAAQTAAALTTVTLNGSGSSDPDGDAITYAWSIASRPSNSAALLQGNTSVNPIFVPDAPGSYVIALTVADNKGALSSVPSTVTVTVAGGNAAPVANAGQSRAVVIGQKVTLDGVQSTDANRDTLIYSWTLTSRPPGSTVALIDAATPLATFNPDVAGAYVASLVVNDGQLSSAAQTVTITARAGVAVGLSTNVEPYADLGPQPPNGGGRERQMLVGQNLLFSGINSSDADGSQPILYNWTLTRPAGSASVLSTATGLGTILTPDAPGTYRPQLVVTDGIANSAPAVGTVVALATGTNAAPWSVAGAQQNVVAGDLVTLSGAGSTDANGSDTLGFSWMLVTRPAGSAAVLANAGRVVQPTFTADVAGVYVASLIATDGRLNSIPDSVAVVALPTTGPYEGNWAGTTGQNPAQVITFLVNANRITSMTFMWVSRTCPTGGQPTVGTTTFTFTPPITAGTGSFAFAQNAGVVRQFNGSFSSPTRATGSMIFQVSPDGVCSEQIVTNFVMTKG